MKIIFSLTLFINEFLEIYFLKMQLKIQAAGEFQTVQVCTFKYTISSPKKMFGSVILVLFLH